MQDFYYLLASLSQNKVFIAVSSHWILVHVDVTDGNSEKL